MTTYITPTIPIKVSTFEGGLNTGELGLKENESDDLGNVEFDKFGSFIKRKGYLWLNPVAIGSSPASSIQIESCGTSEGTALPSPTLRYTVASSHQIDHE